MRLWTYSEDVDHGVIVIELVIELEMVYNRKGWRAETDSCVVRRIGLVGVSGGEAWGERAVVRWITWGMTG